MLLRLGGLLKPGIAGNGRPPVPTAGTSCLFKKCLFTNGGFRPAVGELVDGFVLFESIFLATSCCCCIMAAIGFGHIDPAGKPGGKKLGKTGGVG